MFFVRLIPAYCTRPCALSLSLARFLCFSLFLSFSLSLFLSLSLTHTHIHTHIHRLYFIHRSFIYRRANVLLAFAYYAIVQRMCRTECNKQKYIMNDTCKLLALLALLAFHSDMAHTSHVERQRDRETNRQTDRQAERRERERET